MKKITKQAVYDINQSGLSPFLVGPKGEGKTQFVKDFAKTENKELVILNLSAIESSDFSGMPMIVNGQTQYARPWFLDAQVLFLDEIDRVNDSSVKACLLSLLWDRKINSHSLNENCLIICAGNGQHDAENTNDISGAYADRLIQFDFSYSVDEKIEYLKAKYPNSKLVAFLAIKPELFKEYSSRRIECLIKTGNERAYIDNFLGNETARLFNHYLEENLIGLKDIQSGVYNFNELSSIGRVGLVNNIVDVFFNINDGLENVNKFINLLSQEEKSIYFSKLKRLAEKDANAFRTRASELDKLGFFKKQSEFLRALVG